MGKSKAASKRAKQKGKAMIRQTESPKAPPPVVPPEPDTDMRPTAEQLSRSPYQIPTGPGRKDKPALNLRPDCIAALMVAPAQLDAIQHDAARDWQALRADVLAEIGAPSVRTCLDNSPHGHDGGEGNVALADFWRQVRGAMGPARISILDRTCLDGAWPRDVGAFREALDAFAVVQGRA